MKSKVQLEILADSLRPAVDSQVLVQCANCRRGECIIELGSGMGNVTLQLAEKCDAQFIGIERQEKLFETAKNNLTTNEQHLKGKVEFHLTDIRQLNKNWREKYDRVIMNPPWYAKGTGRLSPKPLRAAAKHELNGTLEDFLAATKFLMKQSGVCVLIILHERAAELQSLCKKLKLHLCTTRNILSHPNLPPLWLVAEIRKTIAGKTEELKKFILQQPAQD